MRALEALNFCIADVQNGMGPYIALFLQSDVGWGPAQIGTALAAGNLAQVLAQTPAGALIDRLRQKRALLIVGIVMIAIACLATVSLTNLPVVTSAQALIGMAGAIFPPCLAAVALGLVGRKRMDRQMGTNQAFNAGGNMFAALALAARTGQKTVLFMHTFPSELGQAGTEATHLIRRHPHVRLVEMGHTHYNEVANDGRVIYAATRSTGQIEEGPVGFAVTCLDGDVVSWKFKALIDPWPLVMITSPADRLFLTAALQPVCGQVDIRARAWCGNGAVTSATCRVDDGAFEPMTRDDESAPWRWAWDSTGFADGTHRLTVRVETTLDRSGEDTITVLCSQDGHEAPANRSPIDRENSIEAYPQKELLGTRLGPNQNGHPWGAS